MVLLLKDVRFAKGLTQYQLARRIGCSRELISSIETARLSPSIARLEELAEALEVSFYDLLAPGPEGCGQHGRDTP